MTAKRSKRSGRESKRGAPALRASVASLRVLAHPLRLRILELCAESPRTTRQVADLLGQPPTRLYHHVNALERAGLLQVRETRPNRGTVERWFGAEPRYASGPAVDPSDGSVAGLAMTVLEQARHEVAAALLDSSAEQLRPLVVRGVVVGAAARQESVRRRLTQLLHELRQDSPRASDDVETAAGATAGTPWALTITFAPVASPTTAAPSRKRGRKPSTTPPTSSSAPAGAPSLRSRAPNRDPG